MENTMPFVKYFEKDEMPIEIIVDGTVVKGYFACISKRDYTVVLEENPEYKGGSHIPLLGGPPPYLFCTSDGEPTPQCIKSAQHKLKNLWQDYLFHTEYADEIERLKASHAEENAKRKEADEQILKTSTRALYKQLQEGILTKEEHLEALKKRREAKDDLEKIEYEISDKISELCRTNFPIEGGKEN